MFGGKMLRLSARTRLWHKAQAAIRHAEGTGLWIGVPPDTSEEYAKAQAAVALINQDDDITLLIAIERFISKLKERSGGNLGTSSEIHYRITLRRLQEFLHPPSKTATPDKPEPVISTPMCQIDGKVLLAFQDTWTTFMKGKGLSPQTAGQYITRLRKFGKVAVKRGWWPRNYADDLEYPLNYTYTERWPYKDEELKRILHAARTIVLDCQQVIDNFELETFILVMLHVGMAICDATLLKKSAINRDVLRYKRIKTIRRADSKLVAVPLDDELLERLNHLEKTRGLYKGENGEEYYFCHGSQHAHLGCE
jgi:integrase